MSQSTRTKFETLPASQAIWVTREVDGSLTVTELDYVSISKEARQLFIDKKLFAKLQESERRLALGDALDVLEQDTKDVELRKRAQELILAREAALEQLAKSDSSLKHELKKAKKAADRVRAIGIVGQVAGAASGAVGSQSSASSATGKESSPKAMKLRSGEMDAVPNSTLLDQQTYDLLRESNRPLNHIPTKVHGSQ